jgi:hypothetical protein
LFEHDHGGIAERDRRASGLRSRAAPRKPRSGWALNGAATLHRFAGKWIVAVDEDIDPQSADALFWAMSYRCQPQHDLVVVPHKHPGHAKPPPC